MTAADPYLETYYLPERQPDARTAAVDPRDHDAIDAALSRAAESGRRLAQVPHARCVPRAELHARWAERTFDDAGYAATIRPFDVYRRLIAGDHRPFRVYVCNEGTEWWPGGENRDR